MAAEGLPHTSSDACVTGVLELAERLGYPAADLPGDSVAAGRNAWAALVASADRRRLVQAIGVLTARVRRETKA